MSFDDRISILFVCHANVCRSPLAEGLFVHLATRRGAQDRFRVGSAGTWGMDGAPPHPLSRRLASEHGFELTGSSRSIEPGDLHEFDHMLLMDRSNLADVQRYQEMSAGPDRQPARLRLFRTLADPEASQGELDVPDPASQGRASYNAVYELLERGCNALLDELLSRPP